MCSVCFLFSAHSRRTPKPTMSNGTANGATGFAPRLGGVRWPSWLRDRCCARGCHLPSRGACRTKAHTDGHLACLPQAPLWRPLGRFVRPAACCVRVLRARVVGGWAPSSVAGGAAAPANSEPPMATDLCLGLSRLAVGHPSGVFGNTRRYPMCIRGAFRVAPWGPARTAATGAQPREAQPLLSSGLQPDSPPPRCVLLCSLGFCVFRALPSYAESHSVQQHSEWGSALALLAQGPVLGPVRRSWPLSSPRAALRTASPRHAAGRA